MKRHRCYMDSSQDLRQSSCARTAGPEIDGSTIMPVKHSSPVGLNPIVIESPFWQLAGLGFNRTLLKEKHPMIAVVLIFLLAARSDPRLRIRARRPHVIPFVEPP